MEIKASCRIDERLTKMLVKRRPLRSMILPIVFSAVYLGLLGYSAYLLSLKVTKWTVLTAVLAVGFTAYGAVRQLTVRRRLKKHFGKHWGAENKYVFGPEGFEAVETAQGINSVERVEYQKLERLVETKEYFLAYTSKILYYPILKETIEGGTEDELRALLTSCPETEYRLENK